MGGELALMVKLVYTPDLGSGAVRRESSSLSWGTLLFLLYGGGFSVGVVEW